ncbi:hypothetical protein HFN89_04295 [Rhizobium laguerreae]|nr:hypothetical protein [Rhizobium laguerreae]
MRVVFPVPYLDRLEPRSEDLCIRLDDVVECEVPEATIADARIVVSARSSRIGEDNGVYWRRNDLRYHGGKLLRRAGHTAAPDNYIEAQDLPQRLRGRIDWKHIGFVPLLPGSKDRYLHDAAVAVRHGKSGFIRIRARLDEELLVEWSRDRMREMTQRALERLVVVDGEVWKQTNWPRIMLGGDRELMALLTFDEEKEWVRPHYGHMTSEHRMILLSQAHKIPDIAAEAGRPLAEGYQVAVDYIARDALPFLNERVDEAWRVAATLEHRVSSIIGEQSPAAVASWLALREAVRERDPKAEVDDILEIVFTLKDALDRDRSDIVSEVVAETDRMLSVFDLDEMDLPALSARGGGPY